MIRYKQTFETGETLVHFIGVFQGDYSLCGQDLAGDSLDERGTYEQAEPTKDKVDCKHCIEIVKFCTTISKSEYT